MTLSRQPHVEQYLATNGEEGYEWNGATVLLLTTKGRRTGKDRTQALIYNTYQDSFLVVASNGGADAPPDWFLNLRADERVQVQIKGDRFSGRARSATPEEKSPLWQRMLEMWPDYETYQTKTSREIPVVIIDRV